MMKNIFTKFFLIFYMVNSMISIKKIVLEFNKQTYKIDSREFIQWCQNQIDHIN